MAPCHRSQPSMKPTWPGMGVRVEGVGGAPCCRRVRWRRWRARCCTPRSARGPPGGTVNPAPSMAALQYQVLQGGVEQMGVLLIAGRRQLIFFFFFSPKVYIFDFHLISGR